MCSKTLLHTAIVDFHGPAALQFRCIAYECNVKHENGTEHCRVKYVLVYITTC